MKANIWGRTAVHQINGETIDLIVILPEHGAYLGVHKVTSGWSITHVPTGRSVLSLSAGIKNKADAMRICRSLQPTNPIWRNDSGDLIWPQFKDILLRAREEAVRCGARPKTAKEMVIG